MPTRLWYPAEGPPVAHEAAFSGIFISHAVPDAPMAKTPERLPLVVLSHGSGGSSADLCWLAEYLAARGFLVAAVEHVGNRYNDDSPEGFVAVWRRPPDVSRMLDALLAEGRFGPRIAPERIGAAGFSAGGYAVLALAGAIYSPQLMAEFSRSHHNEKTDALVKHVDFMSIPDLELASGSYRDERIRAVFAMSPAVAPGFEPESLAQIHVPVSLVVGAQDEWLPPADHAEPLAQRIPGARLTVLPAGGHFLFMPLCNAIGLQHAKEVCVDRDPSVDRAALHEQVRALAFGFFAEALELQSG